MTVGIADGIQNSKILTIWAADHFYMGLDVESVKIDDDEEGGKISEGR